MATKPGRRPVPAAERFWARVERSRAPNGCWLWTGARMAKGYGLMHLSEPRDTVLVHRFSYMLNVGPIPTGLNVCHVCDNPPCVRPSHLMLGTAASNNQDKARKGRAACPRLSGERHGRAKLTHAIVQEMRQTYTAGGTTLKQLAQRYRVGVTTVAHVIHGDTWRHD